MLSLGEPLVPPGDDKSWQHESSRFPRTCPYTRAWLCSKYGCKFSYLTNVTWTKRYHSNDVTMSAMTSEITSLTIVYWTVYSGADQRKQQSSASLAFVWGTRRWPVNSPHKGPVTRKMFPFDDVIMIFSHFDGCLPYVEYLSVDICSFYSAFSVITSHNQD